MLEINNRLDFAFQVKAIQECMSEIARQEEAIAEQKRTIGATVSVFLYEKLGNHSRGEFLMKLLSVSSWKLEEGKEPEDRGPILKRMCNSGILVGKSASDVSFMSVTYPVKENDVVDLIMPPTKDPRVFSMKLGDSINTINIIFADIIKINWFPADHQPGYMHFGCSWKVAVPIPS